jgi:virginiamycin B lyase
VRALIAVLALLAVPCTAMAAPALNGEFDVSEQPQRIATGPDGNVWFTIATGRDYGRIAPDGTVTEYDFPAGVSGAKGIATGPDGNVWIAANGNVVRVDPASPATPQAFPIAGLVPEEVAAGPDGNVWLTSGTDAIKVGTNGALIDRYTVLVGARGITAGRDGNLWIADFADTAVVRVTPGGTKTVFDVAGMGPQQVAAGAAGQLAFTNPNGTLGLMAYDGTFRDISMPATDPFGVVFGQDGAWWTAQFATNSLGRVTPEGDYTQLPLTPNSGPRYLATGAGNTLWVALQTTNRIARVTGVDPPPGMDPIPPPPDFAPVLSELRVTPRRARSGRRRTVGFKSSEAATGTVRIRRRVKGTRRFRTALTLTRPVAAGTNAIRFKRRLRRGRYRVVVTARDAGSNVSAPMRARFRVTRR